MHCTAWHRQSPRQSPGVPQAVPRHNSVNTALHCTKDAAMSRALLLAAMLLGVASTADAFGRGGGGKTTVYTIKSGKCGECAIKTMLLKFAGGKAGTKGTCKSVGYTTKVGETSQNVPMQGKVTCPSYTKPAAGGATPATGQRKRAVANNRSRTASPTAAQRAAASGYRAIRSGVHCNSRAKRLHGVESAAACAAACRATAGCKFFLHGDTPRTPAPFPSKVARQQKLVQSIPFVSLLKTSRFNVLKTMAYGLRY